jgi:hypothetical protein
MKGLYSIVGMKHRGSEALVASLPKGEPLTLIREPSNKFDRNAVQIWAQSKHIGYVRATQVAPLAAFIDANGAPPLNGDRKGPSIDAKFTFSADRWPMAEVEE